MRGDALRIVLEAPITYEAGDAVVHTPMVEASLAGVPTRLILDTGASDHVFTLDLAEQAGLPVEPTDPGTDAAGAPVPSWLLGDISIRIGDRDFELNDVVAISGPEPFRGWGVGGFLSPQHLHPTAQVVLDLVDDTLVLLDGDQSAAADWVSGRHASLKPVWLERQPGEGTILVRTAIEPHDAVVTLLDTGGKATEFARPAVPGIDGAAQEIAGRGVSGTEVTGSVAEGQTLRVGDAALPVRRLFVRPSIGNPEDGLVGMDLLRGTVLMVAADRRRRVLWLVRGRRRRRF